MNNGHLSYTAPQHLGLKAKAIWRKVVPFLEEQKSIERIDSTLVEMYCTQYEIYRNSYDHIKKHGEVQGIYKTTLSPVTGEVVSTDFVGYKRNPMTQIYSDAIKNLTKIGSELGLSPKSRSELMELNLNDDSEADTAQALKDFLGDDDNED